MAKIAFTKLGLKLNKDIKTFMFADQEIEVRQYLTVSEKLDMISRIINNSADDMKFYNVGKLNIFMTLEIIYNYTNINFTDKQKEDVTKLYDFIVSSGFYDAVVEWIPEEELDWIEETLMDTVDSIYKYQNSIMGILDTISQDYSSLDFDATEIQKKIGDPENLALLKGIMSRLG
jgi:hypothetical protein